MIVKDNCLKVCWTFKTRTFENITINYASSLVDTHFLNVNKPSAKESMKIVIMLHVILFLKYIISEN